MPGGTFVIRRQSRGGFRWLVGATTCAALAAIAPACGGGDGGKAATGGGNPSSEKPHVGGTVNYALESETSGGWCLPSAQLAISGIQVAAAVYDTLTAPDANGDYEPFLAKSLTHNDTYTEWTIHLRDGVKFHDGTALNATVVKNNIDAWRGKYPARKVLLAPFTLTNITSVDVVDDLSVKVTMKTPWPAYPAYLHANGRFGIMAQAQLDDPSTCDSKLIGTGPFKFQEWKQDDHLTVVKNADYWRKDANGTRLPYLDSIVFRPTPDSDARVNALLAGEVDVLHTSSPENIDRLRSEADGSQLVNNESGKFAEVSYLMFNASKAPFNNINARLAAAYAIDRDKYNEVRNLGVTKVASGPFADGAVGHLDDTGFPKYNLETAKEYVKKYEAEVGGPITMTISASTDPSSVKSAQFLQEALSKAGIDVDVRTSEQAALINTALGSDWTAIMIRNHPGGAPDLQKVWWATGSPVNLGKFADPVMDQLLTDGRAETDPAKSAVIYEQVNKRFASQAWNVWLNWTLWDVATSSKVHGIRGTELPGGGQPFPGLASGHPVDAMWISGS